MEHGTSLADEIMVKKLHPQVVCVSFLNSIKLPNEVVGEVIFDNKMANTV